MDDVTTPGSWGNYTEPSEEPSTVPQTPGVVPGETTATEGIGFLPQETGENTSETLAATLQNGGGTPPLSHGWCFAVMGVLAALCLGLLIALITGAFRPRKRRAAAPVSGTPAGVSPAAVVPGPAGALRVGKLHCQGGRESQQDCMAVSPLEMYPAQGVLAVVADGMGGLSDGDKVSQAAASAMLEGFLNSREPNPLLALTARANQAVNALLGPGGLGASGTTLVAGIVRDGFFDYVSVGDSRICLYRQGDLIQLNREHIYRNELSTRAINGMGTLWDAQTHPKAGGLTSYLGMGELKYVDIPAEPLRLRAGDRIILMSDGVYNALTRGELESALGQEAQQAADTIVRMIHAKAFQNQDNYTAVILEF